MSISEYKKLLKKDGYTEPQIAKLIRLLDKFSKNNNSSEEIEDDEDTDEEENVAPQPVKKNAAKSVKINAKSVRPVDKGVAQTKTNNNPNQKGTMPRKNMAVSAGPVQAKGINMFDKMPERNGERRDIAVDKKLSVFEPTPRRGQANLVEVECRRCHTTETIPPGLVLNAKSYICQSCILDSKR